MDTELIWRQFHQRLRLFIARRVGNQADVEDILQEVFLRIQQRLATLKDADRLVAWAYQITRNAIVDYYRSPARQREIASGGSTEVESSALPAAVEASDRDADPAELRRELSSCLRPMIEQLPDPYREAIVLVELEGITNRAAAERLGLSSSGVKSRVQRGRHQLKAMLRDCCHIQLGCGGGIIDCEVRDPSRLPCDASVS